MAYPFAALLPICIFNFMYTTMVNWEPVVPQPVVVLPKGTGFKPHPLGCPLRNDCCVLRYLPSACFAIVNKHSYVGTLIKILSLLFLPGQKYLSILTLLICHSSYTWKSFENDRHWTVNWNYFSVINVINSFMYTFYITLQAVLVWIYTTQECVLFEHTLLLI